MGRKIGEVKLFPLAKIVNQENVKLGEYIIFDDFSYVYATGPIVINSFVHICCFSSIIGGNISIGSFSAISQGARLIASTDDFKNDGFGNSTLSMVTRKHDYYRNTTRGFIDIGKFSIIGANSVVLPNVKIAEGVAVGALSKVTRDLNIPYAIYQGNKKIGMRNEYGIKKKYEKFLEECNGK